MTVLTLPPAPDLRCVSLEAPRGYREDRTVRPPGALCPLSCLDTHRHSRHCSCATITVSTSRLDWNQLSRGSRAMAAAEYDWPDSDSESSSDDDDDPALLRAQLRRDMAGERPPAPAHTHNDSDISATKVVAGPSSYSAAAVIRRVEGHGGQRSSWFTSDDGTAPKPVEATFSLFKKKPKNQ